GQLGAALSEGLLKTERTVVPVLRHTDLPALAKKWPDPELVLVSTGEDDLGPTLKNLPPAWKKGKVGVLQNELIPAQWHDAGIVDPTVLAIWFEKKKQQPFVSLVPSLAYGPHKDLMAQVFAALDLPLQPLAEETEMKQALLVKNTYIFATNIASFRAVGTTGRLWQDHHALAVQLMQEISAVQSRLIRQDVPWETVQAAVKTALLADPQHKCGGRSARRRLERFLFNADRVQADVPLVRRIAQENHVIAQA
ncbi:MAG: hypothetical protein OWS74_07560, partial [Firmicutes bacterium]|nr:hypothetical protein [Bacillota bacterium]